MWMRKLREAARALEEESVCRSGVLSVLLYFIEVELVCI